jgi:2-aminoadipate transaminase
MPTDTSRRITFSAAGERAEPPTIAALMNAALEIPGLLSLAAGFTDNRSLPMAAVQAAVNELAELRDLEPLQYGTNQGRPVLRRQLATHLANWEPGLADAEADKRFFVTNGSQQALYLAMQVLCEPGDIVLVDRPTYFVYLEMLRAMGVRAVSLPIDDAGSLDFDALDARLRALIAAGEQARIRAVYFVSYFSNPSSRCLQPEEKRRLATVLQAHDLVVPVVEDAAYRDLYFSEPPKAPSVLGMPEWVEFPRLYLSTLTKPFSTGLKIGYGYCTDQDWLGRMLHTKGHHDFGSANFNQAVLERVLAKGGLGVQLAKIRPLYAEKMTTLHDTVIAEGLADAGWHWQRPDGGLYLWLRGPAGLDTGLNSAFCEACIEAGVLYVPGDLCYGDDGPKNRIRLSFGVLSGDALREAGRRFTRVARSAWV